MTPRLEPFRIILGCVRKYSYSADMVLSVTSETLFSLIFCVIHLCKNTFLNSICEANVFGARFFALHIFVP